MSASSSIPSPFPSPPSSYIQSSVGIDEMEGPLDTLTLEEQLERELMELSDCEEDEDIVDTGQKRLRHELTEGTEEKENCYSLSSSSPSSLSASSSQSTNKSLKKPLHNWNHSLESSSSSSQSPHTASFNNNQAGAESVTSPISGDDWSQLLSQLTSTTTDRCREMEEAVIEGRSVHTSALDYNKLFQDTFSSSLSTSSPSNVPLPPTFEDNMQRSSKTDISKSQEDDGIGITLDKSDNHDSLVIEEGVDDMKESDVAVENIIPSSSSLLDAPVSEVEANVESSSVSLNQLTCNGTTNATDNAADNNYDKDNDDVNDNDDVDNIDNTNVDGVDKDIIASLVDRFAYRGDDEEDEEAEAEEEGNEEDKQGGEGKEIEKEREIGDSAIEHSNSNSNKIGIYDGENVIDGKAGGNAANHESSQNNNNDGVDNKRTRKDKKYRRIVKRMLDDMIASVEFSASIFVDSSSLPSLQQDVTSSPRAPDVTSTSITSTPPPTSTKAAQFEEEEVDALTFSPSMVPSLPVNSTSQWLEKHEVDSVAAMRAAELSATLLKIEEESDKEIQAGNITSHYIMSYYIISHNITLLHTKCTNN